MTYQLDLFQPYDEFFEIKMTLQEYKESQDKLRKRYFASEKNQDRLILELMNRLTILEERK